uniref:Uncharacterized protein n=1 Tax=Pyxicephalus adspersus TaxID=30357 RepID=A0AAV2ZUL3_PYXAD|nr:TPA: hypothetical protein GDO54_017127 [Pyxicephalus adspersus]
MEEAGSSQIHSSSNFRAVAESNGSVSSEPGNEIWLIRTPIDFTPESFNSHRFPLPGYKMQKVKWKGMKKFCHVISSPSSDAPFKAFLCPPQGSENGLLYVPSFEGTITVAEAHGDPSALHSIPDRHPPTIPEGLKQRYQPFGSLPPRVSSGEDAAGSTKKKKKAKKRRLEEAEH